MTYNCTCFPHYLRKITDAYKKSNAQKKTILCIKNTKILPKKNSLKEEKFLNLQNT